jgi:hypothetical protein
MSGVYVMVAEEQKKKGGEKPAIHHVHGIDVIMPYASASACNRA